MKLLEIKEIDYKKKFQNMVRKGKLYHKTGKKQAAQIEKEGFKAGAYFGFNDEAWVNGSELVVVNGKDVASFVYPDPEHLIDHPEISAMKGTLGWKTITKKFGAEALFKMYFELAKQEEWDQNEIHDGFWLICTESIPAKNVTFP